MSQIIHTARCLSVALVLVAAFVTLAGAPQASAETRMTPSDMEAVCLASGGIYYETYDENGAVASYGCYFPDGDELVCDVSRKTCWYIYTYPAPDPFSPVQSAPTDAYDSGYETEPDPYPPVQSAPADAYDSGYQYQVAGQ